MRNSSSKVPNSASHDADRCLVAVELELPDETVERLDAISLETGRSRDELIAELLDNALHDV
jgi:predicted DNA-binding protein